MGQRSVLLCVFVFVTLTGLAQKVVFITTWGPRFFEPVTPSSGIPYAASGVIFIKASIREIEFLNRRHLTH